jgi:hypothetical protein
MPIKYKKRVDPSGVIKNLETINVTQHGSKQVTSYTSTFRVTAVARDFFPLEHACWAKRVGLPLTAVTFIVFIITDPHRKLIKTGDPFILHCLGSKDNGTKERFTNSSSEHKQSKMCIFCCGTVLRSPINCAQIGLTPNLSIFTLRCIVTNFINKNQVVWITGSYLLFQPNACSSVSTTSPSFSLQSSSGCSQAIPAEQRFL